MSLTVNADVPGSAPGSNLPMNKWQDSIEGAVYESTIFLRRIREVIRGYGATKIRKITAGTGQTVSSTNDGTDVTFVSMNPDLVTISPTWYFFGHGFPDSLGWTSGDGIDSAAADDVEEGIAAHVEGQALALPASLTNYVGNNAYDAEVAGFRAAVATLMNAGKVKTRTGKATIYGLLNTLQHDDAMSIPEFTNADQSGKGDSPNVSGVFGKGNGVLLDFSSLVNSDGNGSHGCLWVESAFGHFWNKRISVERQRFIKQTRIMADCHLGFGIIHNLRAIAIRTKTT